MSTHRSRLSPPALLRRAVSRSRALLASSGLRSRRISAGPAWAALLGVLMAMVPVTPASAAGRPNVEVTITNASGTPIDVVPSTANFEYQVRASYTCIGDTDCTNMKVSIEAPAKDPYYGTQLKEDDGTWTPPFSPAPTATGSWDTGWSINLGTIRAGDVGTVVFRYFIKAPVGSGGSQIVNNLCCGNFFPPGFAIEPEVTVTADNAEPVTKADHATYQSIVPTPSLTVSAQAKVKTDTELPVTVNAVSNCWRRNDYGTFKALYDRLCSDSASITVKLPTKAEYVAGSGGSYDAGTHAVTLNAGPDAWRGLEGGAFKVTFSGSDYPTSGAGCAVSESFVASGTLTYLNGDVKATSPASFSRAVTVDNCTPFTKGTFSKSTPRASYQIPTTTAITGHYWDVNVYHQGNVPAVATVTDTTLDQPGLPVHSIATNSSATFNVTLIDGSTESATGTLYEAPDGQRIVSATVVSDRLAGVNSDPAGSSYDPVPRACSTSPCSPARPSRPDQHRERHADLPGQPGARHVHSDREPRHAHRRAVRRRSVREGIARQGVERGQLRHPSHDDQRQLSGMSTPATRPMCRVSRLSWTTPWTSRGCPSTGSTPTHRRRSPTRWTTRPRSR